MPVALAFSASTTLCAVTVRWRLHRNLDKRRVGLLDQGDVSRLMAAVALGALVAALGTGLTAWVADRGDPLLTALSGFGSHAASLMILLPFFVEAPQFPPLAARRERVVQSVLTLGATTLLFLFSAAPPLVFAVMPMFAWLAFRGTLREASLLLVGVSIVANTLTAFQLGPVWDLQGRYDLPPQLAGGFLQLFLLDCALLLLPLSVMVTQQRTSAARAASRSRTLERLISSATGTAVIATDERRPRHGLQPRRGGDARLSRRGRHGPAARRVLPRRGALPARGAARHRAGLRRDRGRLRRHRGQRHPVAVPSS